MIFVLLPKNSWLGGDKRYREAVADFEGFIQLCSDESLGHKLAPGRVPQSTLWLPAPIMPSEDFSYILQRVPGAMVFLGARPEGEGPFADVHSPRMILNENAMAVGVALHAAVTLRLLEGDIFHGD